VKTEDHIKRYHSDPDGLDFDGLRRKGIALLQDLSGHAWTDYNLHDPGVTLLELLSYGLTDLVYRTDFDVADLLTGPSGQIEFDRQALFRPQDIFPNQPVTDIDFCKLIYDNQPQVDDVWIRPAPEPGLCRVFIKPHESLFHNGDSSECEELRRAVQALAHAHRNLCRDVAEVRIVRARRFGLSGEIEIDDSRPAAEIYADIYFRCAKEISSGGQVVRFEDALAQGMSWEQMLEGPLTYHGYIADEHFRESNYEIDVTRLIKVVRHIPGVRQVKRLCLLDDEHGEHSFIKLNQTGDECPVLAFRDDPETTRQLHLVHGKSATRQHAGSHAVQFHGEVSLYLRKLEFEHDAFRNNDGQLQRLVKLPQGRYRPLEEYGSLGEHTPAIYGINRYGVPDSDPPEVHARAGQLKAYLYPFEQIMANYLASLQGLKQLYSSDPGLDRSYFTQFLDDAQVANLRSLYREGTTRAGTEAVQAGQDAFDDRRSRVLDSLLAIYGEVFPDETLKRYDVYHADAFGRHLIACKIGLLQHLCELSARRGLAMNVMAPYWKGKNHAPIQRRIQLLCGGSESALGRSLIQSVHNEELRFVSDTRYARLLEQEVPYGDTEPMPWPGAVDAMPAALPHGAVCPSLLRAGVLKENYRVHAAEDGQGWLCLNLDDKSCWPLLRLPLAEIGLAAYAMRDQLIALSKACEGFHLLEHVLLRPRSGVERAVEPGFYAHRVSVILPSFTARFGDKGCQAWIEQLIAQNLPAHVLPSFYWLDFAYVAWFEMRYREWLGELADGGDPARIDEAAGKLIDVLDKIDAHRTNRHWI